MKVTHRRLKLILGCILLSYTFFLAGAGMAATGTTDTNNFTAAAIAGGRLIGTCNACHEQTLDPPKGPPLFGIQRKYRQAYPTKHAFINAITAFVKQPSSDKALMHRAVKTLGLMPALALPQDQLEKIAAYLYEYPFPPPCAHWKIAVTHAETEGNADPHIARDRLKLQRFCQ